MDVRFFSCLAVKPLNRCTVISFIAFGSLVETRPDYYRGYGLRVECFAGGDDWVFVWDFTSSFDIGHSTDNRKKKLLHHGRVDVGAKLNIL